MIDTIKGLATGIGSLPHRNAQEALDLVFKYTPQVPFWPQLPQKNKHEEMIRQFSENLPLNNKEDDLEEFYGRVLAEDIEYFKISETVASGLYAFKRALKEAFLKEIKYLKIQTVGPFTLAASLKKKEGLSLLYDKVLLQVILKGLNLKARWQISIFKPFGKKLILFIDEPYLSSFDFIFSPLSKEEIISTFSEFTESLKEEDVLLGLHCCGNIDWSIFTELTAIDIISFDVFNYLDKFLLYAESLKKFLKRGGTIAWGIVPTYEFNAEEDKNSLLEIIQRGIKQLAQKGIDEEMLWQRLMITPSCGLGTLDVLKAEKIFSLLSEISQTIQNHF